MDKRFLQILQRIIFGLDLLSLNVLVFTLQLILPPPNADYHIKYTQFWIILNICWGIMSWLNNLYHKNSVTSFETLARRSMHTYFLWLGLIMVYLFFTHLYQLSRIYTAIVLGGYGIMLLINRFIYLGILSYFKHSHSTTRQIMILGYNERAKRLANYFETEEMHTKIVGFCEKEERVKELSNYPILSSIDKTIELSKQYEVSDIYSTITPEQDAYIYNIMEQADQSCIHFRLIPDLSLHFKQAMYVDYLGDIPVLTPRKEPLTHISNQIVKRICDLLISSIAIVFVLSWLMPLIALLIKIESRGPVFFVQPRTGRNNKTFNCLKFRSMKQNSCANSLQATRDDERITRLGRFLRRTNLDEFPQFINVLKGEMSLVGPRPHMLKHTEDYSKLINKYMVRQFLKPGITGWAQVNGFRGETKTLDQMSGRVEHDIWYMENWSMWLDMQIIFQTVYNTFKGDKNAF